MNPRSSIETINPAKNEEIPLSQDIWEDMMETPVELQNPISEQMYIMPYLEEIKETIAMNPVSAIVAPPGYGKTVGLVPVVRQVAIAYRREEDPTYDPERHVAPKGLVLEPRVKVTKEVAKTAAKIRGVEVGEEVGYQAARVKEINKNGFETDTNIMTVGTFLGIWARDHVLKDYDWFILDEAHEESADMAMALGFIQITNRERAAVGLPPVRVVITSATIDLGKYGERMSHKSETNWSWTKFGSVERKIPIASCEIKEHQESTVSVEYLKRELSPRERDNYIERSAQRVADWANTTNKPYDALAFVPGVADVYNEIERIKELLDNPDEFEIYAFYGAVDEEVANRIFDESPKRKIIVATEAAATSFTLPKLEYVDDTGRIKEVWYNRKTGIQKLEARPHSQAGMIQRMRRAGRKQIPGRAFRDCTEQEFKNRDEYSTPELLRTHLGPTILKLKSYGIRDVRSFEWVDPPPLEYFEDDIRDCQLMGALDSNENLTNIGKRMLKYQMDEMEYQRMMVAAEDYGCTDDILTLIAFIEQRKIYDYHKWKKTDDKEEQESQREKQRAIYRGQANITTIESDPISFLRTYKAFEHNNYTQYNNLISDPKLSSVPTRAELKELERGWEAKWAEEHHVLLETLYAVRREKQKLSRDLPIPAVNTRTYSESSDEVRDALVGKAFTAAYIKNLMTQDSGEFMRRIFFPQGAETGYNLVKKHASSRTKAGPGIRAGSFMVAILDSQTDRDNPSQVEIFAKVAQTVDPRWIMEVAPHLVQKQRGLDYDYDRELYFETTEAVLKGTDIVLKNKPSEPRHYLSKNQTEQENKRRREEKKQKRI